MSLDGLRAWIGEVERKLGMRTRVFLVLSALAIGGAGAAIYLAIDTRDNAVDKGDIETLQQQVSSRLGAGAGSEASQLSAEVEALRAEVQALKSAGGTSEGASGGTTGPTGASGSSGPTGAPETGAVETAPGAGPPGSSAELKELVQKAQEEAEQQAGR